MRSILLAFAALLAIAVPGQAFAERRVALVVGNGAYDTVPALPNPGSDADAMAEKLGALGFDVLLLTDLDQAGMAAALGEFASALQDADVGLFFYAGHGVQFDARNYLISTNATLGNQFALQSEAFSLDQIVEVMQQSAALNIVLLDACRNNPFVDRLKESLPAERSTVVARGLAPVSQATGDTMIVYATAANQTAADGAGDHSPFTQALLDNLGTPGIEVSQLFKRVIQDVREKTLNNQRPEVLSAMATEFYFANSVLPPQFAELDGDISIGDFGLIAGQRYIDTSRKFTFVVPPGYVLELRERSIWAMLSDREGMRVDSIPRPASTRPDDYLPAAWLPGIDSSNLRTIPELGLVVATATGLLDGSHYYVSTVFHQALVLRFLFLSKTGGLEFEQAAETSVRSFEFIQ